MKRGATRRVAHILVECNRFSFIRKKQIRRKDKRNGKSIAKESCLVIFKGYRILRHSIKIYEMPMTLRGRVRLTINIQIKLILELKAGLNSIALILFNKYFLE